ncbi:hypothetical protein JR311_19910 (plasmid) [Bacillus velezensis]|uniref:hypothetical protein n=1 Tax=Bacillus velezensis TaxID=492670 RepID=UPI00195C4028|nr:hypothetical protein [Bacillus velezensis]QRV11471.1 hypothetical protein JR311_19910 [Bacillus velezensis]URJ76447.1 hypothetical protein MF619_004020 [Bacillus velezensis]URJ80403.1 hypothetical protein MF621_004154 [Bacillus velezensis]
MAYTRLDKISATAHIESIVSKEDLENGQWLELEDLQADGEARLATPSGNTSKELVFHSSVPLTYEDQTNELDFVLKAGKVGRAYVPEDGQIISISEDGVVGEITKNALVIPDPKGFAVTTEEVTGLHGKIIAIENDLNAGRLAVIRIVK